ncbi:MAG: hypothetical protein RLZZ68_1431 [Bacteroidota bacterium]
MSVRSLEPQSLWNAFADLNAVPRPSKKEERVRQFMVDFGKKLGLETLEDRIGNVIIKKPATPGMEQRTTVILQSRIWTWCIKKTKPRFSILINKELT